MKSPGRSELCRVLMGVAALLWGTAQAEIKPTYELLLSPLPLDKLDLPAAAALALLADPGLKPAFLCLRSSGKTTGNGQPTLDGVPQGPECLGQRAIGGAQTKIVVTQLAVAAQGDCKDDVWSNVEVKEEKRETSAEASLKQLFRAVTKTGGSSDQKQTTAAAQSETNPPPRWCVRSETYTTSHSRSKLEISATSRGEKPEAVASTTVLTGSTEHLFVTGDALFKGAKQLMWDNATKTLSAKEKTDQLYVGINWMKGDVLSKQDAGSLDRLVLKLSFLPTRKPFDSLGVGLGYRLSESVFTLDPSQGKDGGVMVFVGHFWTKGDAQDAAGNPITGGKRERSWRLGLSYSFDTLLGTLKK